MGWEDLRNRWEGKIPGPVIGGSYTPLHFLLLPLVCIQFLGKGVDMYERRKRSEDIFWASLKVGVVYIGMKRFEVVIEFIDASELDVRLTVSGGQDESNGVAGGKGGIFWWI